MLALIAAIPAHLPGRAKGLRPLSITLIGSLVVVAMMSCVVLIVDLVRGSKVTKSASSLLASGALIWPGNALVFGSGAVEVGVLDGAGAKLPGAGEVRVAPR